MADTNVTSLATVMRGDPGLLWDVESFVSSEPGSARGTTFWQRIRQHPALSDLVTRALVYEAAFEFGMRLHPAREKALEDAA